MPDGGASRPNAPSAAARRQRADLGPEPVDAGMVTGIPVTTIATRGSVPPGSRSAAAREGELLEKIPPKKGANQNIRGDVSPKVPTRTDAAKEAGLSKRQQDTALRVAAIPEAEFEAAVESDDPHDAAKRACGGAPTSAIRCRPSVGPGRVGHHASRAGHSVSERFAMPDAAPTSAAARARRSWHRQRRHLPVFPVELDAFAAVDTLIQRGLLAENESRDDGAVARALALAFRQWQRNS
jgi:hypothetical protein